MTKLARLLTFSWLIFTFLTGCSPLSRAEQPVRAHFTTLNNGETIGQTFTARYDGLNGVLIYMKPQSPGEGKINLHLRPSSQSEDDLALASLPLKNITKAGYYLFEFPKQNHSRQTDYYIYLEIEGTGTISAGEAGEETYLNGARYHDHFPQVGQLTFKLSYPPGQVLVGLFLESITWVGWLVAGFALFILPGWVIMSLLWSGWKSLRWQEKLGLASGVTLAIYPLLLLWTDLVGIHLGKWYAWLPVGLGLGWLIWRGYSQRKLFHIPTLKSISFNGNSFSYIIIIGLIFAVRFWVIRNLDVPMWGDSYQHTVIGQLIKDNGGLFTSWEPYAPYHTLSVHYGFSALSALLSWLTNISIIKTTLIGGQLLNGLAALSIYPIALQLSNSNRWAANITVLIAGLLSLMPANYVNWGRYAHLASLVVLPVAMWFVMESTAHQSTPSNSTEKTSRLRSYVPFLIGGLSFGGMLLYHYRMLFFYILFIPVWLVCKGYPWLYIKNQSWLTTLKRLVITGISGGLLFLPWGLRQMQSKLIDLYQAGLTTTIPIEVFQAYIQTWKDLTSYLPLWLQVLVIVGFVTSIFKRKWVISAQVLWILALVGYLAGQLINLPGANLLENFSIIISLYLPASLIAGWLVGEILQWITNHWKKAGWTIATILVLLTSIWGAYQQRNTSQAMTYALVTRPDLRAMTWIKENTPPDALFLVEGYSIYGGTTAVGADAGWWLPLLAGRSNIMPPQYALINEKPIPADYSTKIVNLIKTLEATSPTSPEGIELLCQHSISHVYIGQRQGKIGFGARQLFSPIDLAGSPAFELVYQQDRVYVFSFNQVLCESTT